MSDYLDFKADIHSPDFVATYDELPLWSALAGELLLDHIPLGRGLEVLDVGFGTGFPLLELAQRLGASSRVCGIDPWEAATKRVRFKAKQWGISNIEIHSDDACAMPFADARFDLIVSNLGVNNFADPDSALTEYRRVAKPRGRISITTNLQGHMSEFYQVFEATLRELGRDHELQQLQRHIEGRATVEGLFAMLDRSGFRVKKVQQRTAHLRFNDGGAFLRHSFIRTGFLNDWKQVVDPSSRKLVFDDLERALDDLALASGCLDLSIPLAYVEAERVG